MKTTQFEYDFGKGVHATVFRDATRERSPDHVRSDVIWHRLVRMEEKLAESKVAYDQVDEPALIAALEVIEQLSKECLRLARRESEFTGLRVVSKPIKDGD